MRLLQRATNLLICLWMPPSVMFIIQSYVCRSSVMLNYLRCSAQHWLCAVVLYWDMSSKFVYCEVRQGDDTPHVLHHPCTHIFISCYSELASLWRKWYIQHQQSRSVAPTLWHIEELKCLHQPACCELLYLHWLTRPDNWQAWYWNHCVNFGIKRTHDYGTVRFQGWCWLVGGPLVSGLGTHMEWHMAIVTLLDSVFWNLASGLAWRFLPWQHRIRLGQQYTC